MAKNSVRDFDATAANNTDIQSVDIAENCAPSGINNAIRELMADIKNVSSGTIALESPQADSLTVTGDLTVDTNTLFVDSTNNAVGVGTVSPSTSLDVVRAGVQPLRVQSTSGTEVAINMVNTGGNVQLEAHSGNFTIDADNVGIGTTSPEEALHVYHPTSNINAVIESGDANAYLAFKDNSTTGYAHVFLGASGNNMTFFSGGSSERMRIKSDGTLLIAQTADDSGVAGHIFNPNGSAFHVRDGGTVFVLNRLSSDGTIQEFRKDGTTVGSIGTLGYIYIGKGDTGIGFASDAVQPVNTDTPATRDNGIDLGASGNRFKDLYLGGGAYIGGTGSANKLDDYEEGTFTPQVSGSGVGTGLYTKIGRLIFIDIVITSNSVSTTQIDNMPFNLVSASGYGGFSFGRMLESDVLDSNGVPCRAVASGTSVIFRDNSVSSDDSNFTITTNSSGTVRLGITGVARV